MNENRHRAAAARQKSAKPDNTAQLFTGDVRFAAACWSRVLPMPPALVEGRRVDELPPPLPPSLPATAVLALLGRKNLEAMVRGPLYPLLASSRGLTVVESASRFVSVRGPVRKVPAFCVLVDPF